jgi:hypothetical protein
MSRTPRATFAIPTTDYASVNFPHGTTPTSVEDGDVWTTTAGMFARINGGTVGPFGASGGISDGDKGDITVSGSGATWTIDNNVVTFAKMQDISVGHVIGRHTSGSGDPELVGIDGGLEFQGANIQRSALTGAITASAGSNTTSLGSFTLAQLNTALSDADVATGGGTATGTNTGDQTITLTGDVTGSGTGSFAATLANGVVGIANLSATGTPSASTYLRGDNTWAAAGGGGGLTVPQINSLISIRF